MCVSTQSSIFHTSVNRGDIYQRLCLYSKVFKPPQFSPLIYQSGICLAQSALAKVCVVLLWDILFWQQRPQLVMLDFSAPSLLPRGSACHHWELLWHLCENAQWHRRSLKFTVKRRSCNEYSAHVLIFVICISFHGKQYLYKNAYFGVATHSHHVITLYYFNFSLGL